MAKLVKKPLQARSQATLDRIVEATEKLLTERPLRQISISDIVAQSQTSTGSFYARFPSKESLLPALYSRYEASLNEELDQFGNTNLESLVDAIDSVVSFFIRFFSRRINLLRALAIYVREFPEAVDHEAKLVRKSQFQIVNDCLLRFSSEISHSQPARSIELSMYMITCLCRERILFSNSTHASSLKVGEVEFQHELVTMVFGYLVAPEIPSRTGGKTDD